MTAVCLCPSTLRKNHLALVERVWAPGVMEIDEIHWSAFEEIELQALQAPGSGSAEEPRSRFGPTGSFPARPGAEPGRALNTPPPPIT